MIPFRKMNGLGNEILVADMRARGDGVSREAAVALARLERLGYVRADALGVHSPTDLRPPPE